MSMMKVRGAPINDEEAGMIIEYLVENWYRSKGSARVYDSLFRNQETGCWIVHFTAPRSYPMPTLLNDSRELREVKGKHL